MADANLKARPLVTERFITMQRKRDIGRYGMRAIYDESCEPLFLWLKISGRWLTHDVGFHAGQKLRVHVQHGKLTITAAQTDTPAVKQAEQITPVRRQPR